MRHLLSPKNRPLLDQFALSNVLVALDFDGTLAPIVPRPDDARLRPRTRALLVDVATRYPTAVVSGRARTDVRTRLAEVPLLEVIGNHGIEPAGHVERHLREVHRWGVELTEALALLRGVVLEDKGYSIAIHYRRSRQKRKALALIRAAAGLICPDARVIGGKQVVNLLPRDAPHKGLALERLRDKAGCDTAIYLGDDLTDEDVFAIDQPGRLLSVRIGRSSRSHAPWYLRDQREIDAFLLRLLSIRRSWRQSHGHVRS
ncbi:MAG: trehalose-phosphatase [Deltaproteobacteria bacterium]|nr:trehalose-phosphatase [Deltaproteobacteria bacterium]